MARAPRELDSEAREVLLLATVSYRAEDSRDARTSELHTYGDKLWD